MITTKLLTALTMTLVSATAFATNRVPPSILAAHKAYASGNGSLLLQEMKKALTETNNDPLVVKNMTRLYKAAQTNGLLGNAKLDWSLPQEMSYLGFEVQRNYRSESGKVRYLMAASFSASFAHDVQQFQLIRYPNQVILDFSAKVGWWTVTKTDKEFEYWGGSDSAPAPIEDGLYLVNIHLKGQPMMQGWFVLANKSSSASPVVLSPQPKQVVGAQPTYRWNDFKSPEYRGEKRRITVKVNLANEDEDEFVVAQLKGDRTSFQIGDKSSARHYEGPESLPAGDYVAAVFAREVESIGDIEIRRTSTTKVPFEVK